MLRKLSMRSSARQKKETIPALQLVPKTTRPLQRIATHAEKREEKREKGISIASDTEYVGRNEDIEWRRKGSLDSNFLTSDRITSRQGEQSFDGFTTKTRPNNCWPKDREYVHELPSALIFFLEFGLLLTLLSDHFGEFYKRIDGFDH